LIERMAVQCGARSVSIADLPQRFRPADWDVEEAMIAGAPTISDVVAALEPFVDEPGLQIAAVAPGAAPMAPALVDMLLETIPEGFDLRAYLEALEQRLIERALLSSGGTVAQAARLLGLRRTTLVEKLRKYAPGVDAQSASDS
jgi:sigma-54 specific flagellar transcriptional regulator A